MLPNNFLLITTLFALLLFAPLICAQEESNTSQNPTPESLLAGFVEAMGGEMQLQSCENVKIIMETDSSDGKEYKWKVYHNDKTIVSDTNDRVYFRVFNEGYGWTDNRSQDKPTLLNDLAHDIGIYAFPHYLTINRLVAATDQMEYVGEAEFEHPVTRVTVKAYQVKMTAREGRERHFFFAKDSKLLVRHRFDYEGGQTYDYHYEFESNDDLDGAMFLSSELAIYPNGVIWNCKVNTVEFNTEMDESMFETPPDIRKQLSDKAD